MSMKWPGKIASHLLSSGLFLVLNLLVIGIEAKGFGTDQILSPEAFKVRAQLSSLSKAPPVVLS